MLHGDILTSSKMDNERKRISYTLQDCFSDQPDMSAFSDFMVIVKGVSFQCHKVILNACSEYFQALFNSQMKECQENCVDLQGVTKEAFSVIFNAIYKGMDGLTEENVTEVWHAADHLQIAFMITECEHFVEKSMTAQNCLEFYDHAKLLNSNKITEIFFPFVCTNFELCRQENIFNHLPVVDIYKILQDDDLKVDSEDSLVGFILKLIEYNQKNSASLPQQDIVKLLSAVRLCLVTNECFRELFECDDIMTSRAARAMIFAAMNYRLSVGLRHDSWPDAAVHRATSNMKNAMVFAYGTMIKIYLLSGGSVHNYTTLPNSTMANLVVFDNVLYINDCNTLKMYSQNSVWETLLQTNQTTVNLTRRNIMLSLESYIYCIDTMDGCLRRYDYRHGCDKKWDKCIENIEYVESMIRYRDQILLFGTFNNTAHTLAFTPDSNVSLQVSPITGPLDGMVSFTHFENVFILQKNGNLWRVVYDPVRTIGFELLCQLWGCTWEIYGCIVYHQKLFVFGSKNSSLKTFPSSLPEGINALNLILARSDTPFLPIVVDFSTSDM